MRKEEQPATGTIITHAEHHKSIAAHSVAVVLSHVLLVAETVSQMEEKVKDESITVRPQQSDTLNYQIVSSNSR